MPEQIPLITEDELTRWIIEEDTDFIAFNKPGHIVCHPSKNGPWSSLIGATKEWKKQAKLHLVSRLDRETSGILLIAQNPTAARHSQTALEHRQVQKTYLALVHGTMTEPILVDEPIERDPTSPIAIKHRVAHTTNAKTAVTFFTPLHAQNNYTLVRATPHTGRTHQIRLHAQWLKHPIVGDKLYGPDDTLYLDFIQHGWTPRHTAQLLLPRHALHAARIEFKSPHLQRTFTAPLPEDLKNFCEKYLALTHWNPF